MDLHVVDPTRSRVFTQSVGVSRQRPNLPPPDAQRWVASRKAIVVAAVWGGLLSMSDACARYRLTTEEFLNWQAQVDRNGLQGLRTTRIQEYRGGCRPSQGYDGRGASS